MISCPKCGKENQDHYKFCLGCGNELPREAGGQRPLRPTPAAVAVGGGAARPAAATPGGAAPVGAVPPAPFPAPQVAPVAPTPGPFAQPQPSPMQPAGPFGPQVSPQAAPVNAAPQPVAPPAAVLAPPPAAVAPGFPTTCPQCSSPNPRANRFCITCGFDMSTVAAPAAPVPVAAVPVPVPVAPAAQRPQERARLVLIRPDGSEGGTHSLYDGDVNIGRDTGGLFAQDQYLSPHHATFSLQGGSISVRDEGSLNGVYVRIERQQPFEIRDGDVFRIGQEILRYDALLPVTSEPDGTERLGAQTEGLIGRISLLVGRESYGNAFPVSLAGLYLGRERGDILFPEDGYVSGLHCQLTVTGTRLFLTDVGSSNGTYVRLRAPRALKNGDFLLMGQQLFRLQSV